MKFVLVFFVLGFLGSVAAASPLIDVEASVRAEPLWYWLKGDRCVGVPTSELISDIGPQMVAKAKPAGSKTDCKLAGKKEIMGSVAVLSCGSEKVGRFYAVESQCEVAKKKK